MELYRGIVCVTYDELTSDKDGEPVMKLGTLNARLYHDPALRVSEGGGLGRCARIDYYRLRECYRKRFEAKYGDPGKRIEEMRLREETALVMDEEARRFYEDYRYDKRGEETSLPDRAVYRQRLGAQPPHRDP